MAPSRNRLTLARAAELVGARLVGDPDAEVGGIAPIGDAGPEELTFLANPRYRNALETCRAQAVIIAREVEGLAIGQLVVDDPYYAYASLLTHFHAEPRRTGGISPDARVEADAVGVEPDIGAFVTVGPGTRLGDRVTLHPGVRIGRDCTVGDDVTLFANVVVRDGCRLGSRVTIHSGTVVGSDGFGYATHQGVHHKIPHVGRVIVEDDVEIGAGCALDRGALGDTVIGAGSKLDNLVQLAHNVRLGQGCLLASQVGISGSTTLGNYVVIGGQAGIAGHLTVGDRVMIAGKGGVTKDLAGGQMVSGFPAMAHREELKRQAAVGTIPQLKEKIARLEAAVKALSEAAGGQGTG